MLIYISGPCKNGKSTLAENIAYHLNLKNHYYIATMIPHDEEDESRIRRHIHSRAHLGYKTIEAGRDLPMALREVPSNSSLLIDSVTALLNNEMFGDGGLNEEAFINAPQKIIKELITISDTYSDTVFVSDYIYNEEAGEKDMTPLYKRGLATIDKKMAEKADVVIEVVLGQPVFYKGTEKERAWIREISQGIFRSLQTI